MPTLEHFNPVLVTQEIRFQLLRQLKAFGLCNTDYQGTIAAQGGTVRVVKAASLTVKPYTGTIVYEEPDSTALEMSIDQKDYIAATIEDTDQALTSVDLVQKYLLGGVQNLATAYDAYLFEQMALNAGSGNIITSTGLTTSIIVETIDEADTRLKLADLSSDAKKFFTVSPREASLLRLSPHFTKNSDLSDQVLLNGQIGEVFGMAIVESNNLKTELAADIPDGDPVYRYLPYGAVGALSTAFAINHKNTETMRSATAFADNFRALHFYGSKAFETQVMGVVKNKIGTGTDS